MVEKFFQIYFVLFYCTYIGDAVLTTFFATYSCKYENEIAKKDGIAILKGSKILKTKVDKLILKYIIGPSNDQNPQYNEKYQQLLDNELEDYSCFLYLPGGKKYQS